MMPAFWSMSDHSPHGETPRSRLINVNSATQAEKFCTNEISTCKYSFLSFVPRFLIEQFRRYSNVFFLVIAVLQQIPDVSPTGRFTTAVPFVIILSISAIKEIFEDIKRRKSDTKVNNYWTYVLNGSWYRTRWKNVKVGDLVRVESNQIFPADMALLSSSEPQAMAYIETSNLDGETNLKIRQGLECTSSLTTLQAIADFRCKIECEQPNRQVNEFTGTLQIGDLRRPLGVSQLLLRGARLKNTSWVCGAVIYTGHNAKLLMNSMTAPLKRSSIDKVTNRRIIFLFFVLVVLAIVSAIGAQFYEQELLSNVHYLGMEGTDGTNFFWNVLTFFILYNNLIPISLQVTLELVRFFQASYINNDIELYDEASDSTAVARTSNLNEELGQVKFVMSDKTGTLTRNVMKFKKCTIAGIDFGNDETDEFCDKRISEKLACSDESATLVKEFMRMMAVCHTVVPERDDQGNLHYQASSPDEGALVRGAAANGFVFSTRKPQSVTINALGVEETYQVLSVLEFTSDRKRMGVIVRSPSGKLVLYVKGADTMIFDRLKPEAMYLSECAAHLTKYASKGYRTLCFAMRVVSESEYSSWVIEFEKASVAIEKRADKMAECAEKIEKDLLLIGASAIEDKLQDFVPETIRALLQAQMRVWMLTGDKRETAVNIAHATMLCSLSCLQLLLSSSTYDETINQLTNLIKTSRALVQSSQEFVLIIDGSSMHFALTGECRLLLYELALTSRAVVCCRMTPMQKADVVELVQSFGEHVVLAIGDGANDVAMIQAANVGIGISGEEGLQAASASDYAIAQFHFLRRLLLVHGAWDYERGVKVILYSFYKNICLYIIELWFALYSAFSGQTVFERWTIGLFNVAFTALPPIVLGLFDRPLSDSTMLANPSLYDSFQNHAFTDVKFCLWIAMAVWHSLLLYFLSYAFLHHSVVWSIGRVGGWLMLGNSCYSFVVTTVCLKALLECDSWTVVVVLSCIGSVIIWFLFLAIYSLIWPLIPIGSSMAGMAHIMLSSVSFWLALLFIPIFTLFTDFIIKTIKFTYFPTPRELACLDEKSKSENHERWLELFGVGEHRGPRGVCNEAVVPESPVSVHDAEPPLMVQDTQSSEGQEASASRRTSSLMRPQESTRLLDSTISVVSVTPPLDDEISQKNRSDSRGYAFSQDESGIVSQSEIIRSYDSTSTKPRGQ